MTNFSYIFFFWITRGTVLVVVVQVRENFTKQFMESEAASDFSTGAIDNENPEPSPEPEDTPPAA
jgi:hypothetical protein